MSRSSIAHEAMQDLPRLALTLSRLIPAPDRDAIVGDLLEDADYRDLSGPRLTLWLCAECGMIAAGFTVHRMRRAVALPSVRHLAAGLALDGTHALRSVRNAPWSALARA